LPTGIVHRSLGLMGFLQSSSLAVSMFPGHLGVAVHTCKPNTWEDEAGRS
jgi:hypothetical protein